MAYLTGETEVDASVCRSESSDGSVCWAVAWIAGPLVGFATVSKVASNWDGHSPDQKPDDSEAWVRRLDQVVRLGAHSLNFESLGPFGQRWESSMSPVVQWADGSELSLPVFGNTPKGRERVAIDKFSAVLRTKVLTSG
ncbi:hypothetical protein [Pimelobacter simplex]|uniref:hypothetical protein n=1 Tax=Nocardioides simplex TaxID=2045 RepID=UPI001932EBC7|nr:hypothetical protein [Pimelobacter simplex]